MAFISQQCKVELLRYHHSEFSTIIHTFSGCCLVVRNYPSMTNITTTAAATTTRHLVIFTASLDRQSGSNSPSLVSAATIHVQEEELYSNSSVIETVSPHLTLGEANVSCIVSLQPSVESNSVGRRTDHNLGYSKDVVKDTSSSSSSSNSSSVISAHRFIYGVNAVSTSSTGRFTLELQDCHSPVLGPLRSTTPPILFNVEVITEGTESSSTKSGSKKLPDSFIVGNFILQPLTTAPVVLSEDSAVSYVSDDPTMICNVLREGFLYPYMESDIFLWVNSLVVAVLLCCIAVLLEIKRRRRRRRDIMKSKENFRGAATRVAVKDTVTPNNDVSTFKVISTRRKKRWAINRKKKRSLSYDSALGKYATYHLVEDRNGINDFISPPQCSSSAETTTTLSSSDDNTDDENIKKIFEGPKQQKHTFNTIKRRNFVGNVQNGKCMGPPDQQQHSCTTITNGEIDDISDHLNHRSSHLENSYHCVDDENGWHVEGIEHDVYDGSIHSTNGRHGEENPAGFHPFKALSMTNEDWRDTFDKIYKYSSSNSNSNSNHSENGESSS